MSLFKYFGEGQGSSGHKDHGGALRWIPGQQMPPLRNTDALALTKTEFEELSEQYDFKRKTFKLWEADDAAQYCDIRDRAANGWYQIVHITRQFMADYNDELVIMEWLQVYGELANGKRPPTYAERHERPEVDLH